MEQCVYYLELFLKDLTTLLDLLIIKEELRNTAAMILKVKVIFNPNSYANETLLHD